jgi:hypothetical protein
VSLLRALRLTLAATALGPSVVLGQDVPGQDDPAFSWVRVGVGAAWMTPNLPPGDYWRPAAGPALRVETPLSPGLLSFGAQRHRASAGADVTDPLVDEMRWSLLYLGWGSEARLGPLGLGAEGRLGALVNTAPQGVSNRSEREVLFGAAAWARTAGASDWSLRVEGAIARVHSTRAWAPATLGLSVARRIGLGEDVARALRDSGRAARDLAAGGARPSPVDDAPSWWASFPELPEEAFGRDGVSTDRVDRIWSPGHLRAPEAGAPRFWVDGIPVRGASLGGPAWPWLPLGTPDVANLEARVRPGLLAGRPELDGALSASTRTPRPGDRIRARAMTLNESGDPGPLRFTDLTSPNVDGPLYELDASAGHEWRQGWVLASAVRRERWSLTRPELRERNPAFFRGSSSRVRVDGGGLALAQRVGAGRVNGRVWAARGDRFLRGPAIGNELSSDVDHLGAGVSAAVPTAGADTVRLYAALSSSQADSPNRTDPAADPRELGWSERDIDVGAQYRAVVGSHEWTTGVDYGRARDALDGQAADRGAGTVYASYSGRSGSWLLTAGAEAAGGSDGPGGDRRAGGFAGLERSSPSGAWVGATVSWLRGGGGGGLELWDRGVSEPEILQRLGVTAIGLEERSAGRRGTIRAEGGVRAADGEARVSAFLHDFDGERRPAVAYEWTGDLVTGTWGPLESGAGRVLGLGGDLTVRRARASASAAVEAVSVTGTGAFESWWAGHPRVRARADARLEVRPGWTIVGQVRARSGVTWAGLREVTARGRVPGGGDLPGAIDGDVRLEARAVGGRLRLMVGLTNVFDADVRLHPLGAGEARGLLVGVGFGS